MSLAGSSVTLSQNRAYSFYRTRLALYVFLEIFLVRECSRMQLMVALETEDECFSASGCHHLLPERLAVGNIFQLPYVVGSGAVVPCGDRPSPAL